METNKSTNKKIDIFIILSLITGTISICGWFFFGEGGVWDDPLSLPGILYCLLTWCFLSFIALILMAIGVIRSKVKKNTRHLGFIPTILIVTVESFFAFCGATALALVVVVIYVATYKWWAK